MGDQSLEEILRDMLIQSRPTASPAAQTLVARFLAEAALDDGRLTHEQQWDLASLLQEPLSPAAEQTLASALRDQCEGADSLPRVSCSTEADDASTTALGRVLRGYQRGPAGSRTWMRRTDESENADVWGPRVLALGGGVAVGAGQFARTDNPQASGQVPAPVTLAPPLYLRSAQHPLRGRDELLGQLESALSPAGDRRVHVLAGMGGGGKTALALELAHRRTVQGHRVWWVDGRQSAGLEAGLRAVALQTGAAEKELRDGSAADVLWQHLSHLDQPWLLVVDGVDDLAVLDGPRRLIDGTGWVRPDTRGLGSVLVTTRDRTHRRWGGSAVLHEVHSLSGDAIDHATRILLDAGALGAEEDARRLAERLGGLPLALRLVGTYLAEARNMPFRAPDTPATFASYLEALDRNQRLDPKNVIRQTWAMSVDLMEKQGEPLARPLLELIATFANAPVPYTLLLTPQTLADAGDLSGLDGPRLWRLLAGLESLGLIDLAPLPKDVAGSVPALRVHPLVRDAGSNSSALGTAIRIVCSAAFAAETGTPETPVFWDHWRLLQPHALDLFHRATTAGLPDSVVEDAASAAGLAARHLQSRGLYQPARVEFEAILAARRELLGDTHPDTLITRHELAAVLSNQGELTQARAEFEAILAIERELLGDTHPDTLITRHELAAVFSNQGELTQARAELEVILAARRELLGDTHPDTLITRHELAAVLSNQGELTQARAEFEAILAARRELLGDTHPDTQASRARLALLGLPPPISGVSGQTAAVVPQASPGNGAREEDRRSQGESGARCKSTDWLSLSLTCTCGRRAALIGARPVLTGLTLGHRRSPTVG
ncbi:tetratricopeptide repeat protein [Streptomyces sp. NBC_00564]|uniref:tetratricopeptide repeat protein n=1 Tax=Streptomyces sp. NBC_00564 TaxID=2903663 RepID=UPI00352F7361